MALVYRNEAGGQPWANRLAEEAILVYTLRLRDRCRSGLSGSPGKRVLGKTNRGFESHPVRLYFAPTAPRWCVEEFEDRVSHIPEGKNG